MVMSLLRQVPPWLRLLSALLFGLVLGRQVWGGGEPTCFPENADRSSWAMREVASGTRSSPLRSNAPSGSSSVAHARDIVSHVTAAGLAVGSSGGAKAAAGLFPALTELRERHLRPFHMYALPHHVDGVSMYSTSLSDYLEKHGVHPAYHDERVHVAEHTSNLLFHDALVDHPLRVTDGMQERLDFRPPASPILPHRMINTSGALTVPKAVG